MMPGQNGYELTTEIKKQIKIPIILLTAKGEVENRIKGLELGADDYVTKPFSAPELVARIHAVLRRAEVANDFNVTKNVKLTDSPFTFNTASINPTTMEISFTDGEIVAIGRKEIGILSYLHDNPQTIITRKNLIHSVWGIHADIRSRSLDQYIVKIRDLFKRKDVPLENLKTIHGIGYQYEPLEAAEAPLAD